jgi:hypothetical protein
MDFNCDGAVWRSTYELLPAVSYVIVKVISRLSFTSTSRDLLGDTGRRIAEYSISNNTKYVQSTTDKGEFIFGYVTNIDA